ncbi:unnamed protein product [Larinioides sclopetarius]|uniref:Uncharacterized protein n=1 Tax=Larinioides sclopetarius TaxID=280406 RepID=A0AAV2A102_9ARAC
MFPLDFLEDLILDIRFQSLIGLFFLIRWAWRSPGPRREANNKAVFITGCDSGMGHRMARRFDEMGMQVFAGCLQPAGKGALGLKRVCSDRLHIVPIDITNDQQVREAVTYVEANLPPGEKGRIVTITSILARLVYPGVSVYAATKHGLNGFFSALRYEMQEKGIHLATVEPGDFSTTTDIMQWTQRHLEEIWNNMSPEKQKSKLHLFEKTKRKVTKTKCSEAEQERNYKFLLQDVEDAMLAEKPHWRYVSASPATKVALWVLRSLPESWTFKLMGEKKLAN